MAMEQATTDQVRRMRTDDTVPVFYDRTMREIERILDQLNRAYGGEAWHGPALRQLLEDVTEDEARARPVEGRHSIIELVDHIRATMDLVSTRLAGTAKELTTEEDWADLTKTAWANALEELDHAESRVCDAVARLTPDDLDKIVVGRNYTTYVMIHGLVQHNLYHAGQIAIIKSPLRRP
jgi:uncharacterized damage-inducible protein DinB